MVVRRTTYLWAGQRVPPRSSLVSFSAWLESLDKMLKDHFKLSIAIEALGVPSCGSSLDGLADTNDESKCEQSRQAARGGAASIRDDET